MVSLMIVCSGWDDAALSVFATHPLLRVLLRSLEHIRKGVKML